MGCLHFSPECGVMDAIREACDRCHLLGLSSHIFIPTRVLVQSHLCRSFTRPFTHGLPLDQEWQPPDIRAASFARSRHVQQTSYWELKDWNIRRRPISTPATGVLSRPVGTLSMSTPSPNSFADLDRARKISEPQKGAQNGGFNAGPSKERPRPIATSVGGTTVVASEGAASPDGQKSSHVEYLEQIRLASFQPQPEKSLVHNRRPRRPPARPPPSNQRSPPSPPAPTQVPHWSTLHRDGPSAHDSSARIPAAEKNDATPSAEAVDIVHDPSKPPKDVTVRVHLPLIRDFQDELEEFCRLRRFGCFQKAEEYFKGNLDKVSDAPYVMIQHAEALLAAGDFKGVSRVINQQSFEFDTPGDNKNAKKLAINLELLGLLSQPRFPQLAPRALSAAMDGLPGKLDTLGMGSTEVRCIYHILLASSV